MILILIFLAENINIIKIKADIVLQANRQSGRTIDANKGITEYDHEYYTKFSKAIVINYLRMFPN
jgi:hypothetical protein